MGEDGWRPVFSFTLTPRPFQHFLHTMRPIYVNRHISPYFSECHAVRYFTQTPRTQPSSSERSLQEEYSGFCEMIAVKNDTIIELHVKAKKCHTDEKCVKCVGVNDDNKEDTESKSYLHRHRKKASKTELVIALTDYFSMIPTYEIEKALDHYFNAENEGS